MKKYGVYKLNSDNFENALVSPAAYKYITMQMSTGDWHTHTKQKVFVNSTKGVITLQQLKREDEIQSQFCPTCGGAR